MLPSATLGVQSTRAASVKALTEGTLLTLTREDFDSLLGSLADIRHMWRFEALRMVHAPPSSAPPPNPWNLLGFFASAHAFNSAWVT